MKIFPCTKTFLKGCLSVRHVSSQHSFFSSLHPFYLLSVFLLSVLGICAVISFPLLCCILIHVLPHHHTLVSDVPYLSSLVSQHYKTPKNVHKSVSLTSVWFKNLFFSFFFIVVQALRLKFYQRAGGQRQRGSASNGKNGDWGFVLEPEGMYCMGYRR